MSSFNLGLLFIFANVASEQLQLPLITFITSLSLSLHISMNVK